MFKISRCKKFYEKVQICMSKIKGTDVELFQRLCDEYASNLRFNTEGCYEERIGWILPYIENVRDIVVNIKYLKQACRDVRYIKILVINYIYTDDLKNDDIDFSCLSIVKYLDNLSIKGSANSFQQLYLFHSMLYDIIKHTKQISKISFDNIYVERGKCSIKSKDLSENIKKLSHIKEWHLQNVVADNKIFDLPDEVKVLECRHTDCISFQNYKFTELEKLVLEYVKFENSYFKFENLKILEITGQLRGDGIDGNSSHRSL